MYQISINKYLEEHGFEAFHPKAVLFDMDGVLYDSMPNHAIAWQESMAKFGIHMTADDAYATEGARGVDTIRQMVRQQLHREIDEAEAQRMYDEKSRIFHSLPEAPLMPGILDLMRQIQAAGMQCGIVTGSGQLPLIQRLQKDFGAFVDQAHITTAYDVKHGKPAPDPYLMGLQKAGNLKPYEAIVVENAPLGVRSGHAARIFTIAVNTGPLPNEVLLGAGANILFPTMPDLAQSIHSFLQISI
jgi:HAD superfamily hydrolase (TIGR01509 family)